MERRDLVADRGHGSPRPLGRHSDHDHSRLECVEREILDAPPFGRGPQLSEDVIERAASGKAVQQGATRLDVFGIRRYGCRCSDGDLGEVEADDVGAEVDLYLDHRGVRARSDGWPAVDDHPLDLAVARELLDGDADAVVVS